MCCHHNFGRGFFGIGIGCLPGCLNHCGGVDAVYENCCCRRRHTRCEHHEHHEHRDCDC